MGQQSTATTVEQRQEGPESTPATASSSVASVAAELRDVTLKAQAAIPSMDEIDAAFGLIAPLSKTEGVDTKSLAQGIHSSSIEFGPGADHPMIAAYRQALNKVNGLNEGEPGFLPDSTVNDAAMVEAIKSFQSNNGLKVDGIIGEFTTAAMALAMAGSELNKAEAKPGSGGENSLGLEKNANAKLSEKLTDDEVKSSVERLIEIGDGFYNTAPEEREMADIAKKLIAAGRWEEAKALYQELRVEAADAEFRDDNREDSSGFLDGLRAERSKARDGADLEAFVKEQATDSIGDTGRWATEIDVALKEDRQRQELAQLNVSGEVEKLARELKEVLSDTGDLSGDRLAKFEAILDRVSTLKEEDSFYQAFYILNGSTSDLTSAVGEHIQRYAISKAERIRVLRKYGFANIDAGGYINDSEQVAAEEFANESKV